MSITTMRNEDIRALDQTRQRLLQLTTAIQTLQSSLLQAEPLPPWSSFQLQVKIISQHIESVSNILSTHDQILSRLAIYPLPNFPSRTHEGLLGQLLRKKVEPGVEDWIAEGQDAADVAGLGKQETELDRKELEEIWDWAPGALQDSFRTYADTFGGNYTLEERAIGIESIRTGLRRELPDNMAESDDDDEEDSDDENTKDDIRPKAAVSGADETTAITSAHAGLPLNDQLKYLMTGVLPARMPSAMTR